MAAPEGEMPGPPAAAGDDRRRAMILALRWPGPIDVTAVQTREQGLALLRAQVACIGERDWLERDSSFRQLVPYVLLHDSTAVLRYRRGHAGLEDRLHGRYSYGFGGHIDLGDVVTAAGTVDLAASLARAAEREVLEEVGVEPAEVVSRRFLGLIAETDSEVERVHLGWVEAWALVEVGHLASAESAIADLSVVTLDEAAAAASGERCERWSQLALGRLARQPLVDLERGSAV